MRNQTLGHFIHSSYSILAIVVLCAGCASTTGGGGGTADSTGGSKSARKFLTDDGRTIEIGNANPSDAGLRYNNPHMEKGKCWIAEGFNFSAFDTLYLAPVASTAKFPDKPEDTTVHTLAKERLLQEMVSKISQKQLFASVVTKESDIKPGAKVLRLEQTITEFSKGGGAARYWVGLYGGGQPILRVQGNAVGNDKSLFSYEMRRSGISGGARMVGAFMKDEDIQLEDIRSLVLDLTDFMAAVGGKYTAKP